MSIFSIFNRKNPYQVHIEDCLRKASVEGLRQFAAITLKKTDFDESHDLPQLASFLSSDDPRLIDTVATVTESSWEFFRELVTDGGKVITLSIKDPNGFETAMNAMGALVHLPYFTCETPDVAMNFSTSDDLPDLTFSFAIAEEIRSTFNRHLKAMDREHATWTNLWKLACSLVEFQGICTIDTFIKLARDRFQLTLPTGLPDTMQEAVPYILDIISTRNNLEKGNLRALSDAFVLPRLENMQGLAENIRQRRTKEFASSPKALSSFVNFTHEHALTDADLYLEDATGRTISTQTVGRNDPCPCGSGKKFKKCCGR